MAIDKNDIIIVGNEKMNGSDSVEKKDELVAVSEYVDEILDFDECKAISMISAYKKYIVVGVNGDIILTHLILDVLNKKFKGTNWREYIAHSSFKKVLISELGLKGEFHIVLHDGIGDSGEGTIYEFIKKSESEKLGGVNSNKIENILNTIMNLRDGEQRAEFLRKTLIGIDAKFTKLSDLSIEERNNSLGKGYTKYISEEIAKSIYEKYKKTFGIEVARGISYYLFYYSFEYINGVSGINLLSESTNIIVDKLFNNINSLNDKFNGILDKSSDRLNNIILSKGNRKEILEFIANYSNDELLEFKEKIKLWYKTFYLFDINDDLVSGLIDFLITNKSLNINIEHFSNSLFSLFEDNTAALNTIFLKYNGKNYKEEGNIYNYSQFNIRDLPMSADRYDINKLLINIKHELNTERDLSSKLNKSTLKLKQINSLDSIEKRNIKKINLKINELSELKDKAEGEMKININQVTRFNFVKNNFLKEKIEKLRKFIFKMENYLNDKNIELSHILYLIDNRELREDIVHYREQLRLTSHKCDRIRVDFIRTILLGRKLIK